MSLLRSNLGGTKWRDMTWPMSRRVPVYCQPHNLKSQFPIVCNMFIITFSVSKLGTQRIWMINLKTCLNWPKISGPMGVFIKKDHDPMAPGQLPRPSRTWRHSARSSPDGTFPVIVRRHDSAIPKRKHGEVGQWLLMTSVDYMCIYGPAFQTPSPPAMVMGQP